MRAWDGARPLLLQFKIFERWDVQWTARARRREFSRVNKTQRSKIPDRSMHRHLMQQARWQVEACCLKSSTWAYAWA